LTSCGRFHEPRASERYNGGANPLFALDQLRFEQFELQPHGPQLIAIQELQILIGSAIRRGLQDCPEKLLAWRLAAAHRAAHYSGVTLHRQPILQPLTRCTTSASSQSSDERTITIFRMRRPGCHPAARDQKARAATGLRLHVWRRHAA